MQIDHDPNEPKIDRSDTIFWVAGAILALMWITNIWLGDLDWGQIGMGFMTGMLLVVLGYEKLGNKSPW